MARDSQRSKCYKWDHLMEVISFYEQIPVVELERLAIQCGLKFVKASEVPQRLPEEQVKLDPKHYPAAA